MGIFDTIAGALRETNENVHGARLKRDTFLTLELLHNAGEEIETQSLQLYLSLYNDIIEKCNSWSHEGKLKIANQLSSKARENKEFDIGQAYGYYLASAFLESMARSSADAKMTFIHLGTVAEEVKKQLTQQRAIGIKNKRQPNILEMADVCMTGILVAAFWPPNNESCTADFMPQLEHLTLDGKIIIVGVTFGVIDSIGQHTNTNQAETLAAMTAFLNSNLNYADYAIPAILKDLMTFSSKPGTEKYNYIRLGGNAAAAICGNPGELEPLSTCGYEVKRLLDEIVLW